MAVPKLSAFEPLQAENLEELVKTPGPCVTIYLPPYRPGEISPRAANASLKDYLHTAQQRFADLRIDIAMAERLLEPMRAFVGSIEADNGFHWTRVILRAPDLLQAHFVRIASPGGVTVGDRFQIIPMIGELQIPPHFHVLRLSKKRVALLRAGRRLEPAQFPPNTPETLDEFLETERPDHDLENRGTVGGASRGRRIRFTTADERETQQAHLADFFKTMDRAVREAVRDGKAPLVLAGVEEDTALYRSITAWPNVVAAPIPARVSDAELLMQASALVRDAAWQSAARVLEEAREKFAPARYSSDPESILRFAKAGRVARLFVGTPAANPAVFNHAAVETVRQSGEVSLVPREQIGDAIGAVLRY